MEAVNTFFQNVLEYAQSGYHQINYNIIALIIAFVAALIMDRYGRILLFTIGATIIQIIADVLIPVARGEQFKLPDIFQMSFWNYVLFLLIGFFIVISILYFLRRLLLRR